MCSYVCSASHCQTSDNSLLINTITFSRSPHSYAMDAYCLIRIILSLTRTVTQAMHVIVMRAGVGKTNCPQSMMPSLLVETSSPQHLNCTTKLKSESHRLMAPAIAACLLPTAQWNPNPALWFKHAVAGFLREEYLILILMLVLVVDRISVAPKSLPGLLN